MSQFSQELLRERAANKLCLECGREDYEHTCSACQPTTCGTFKRPGGVHVGVALIVWDETRFRGLHSDDARGVNRRRQP